MTFYQDVTLELLEDMGVNIIEDSSNDAPEDAFDNQTKPIINLVLKEYKIICVTPRNFQL